MKLPQIKNFRWNYLALSFLTPLGAMLLLMVLGRLAPFGTDSFMSSDAWHQYYPFFKAFRKALLNGENLLYNWTGMGIDYLGLIAYYLGSPLNLLSVLVPENWLLGFFDLLFPLKLAFAGLFFAIFLKKLFGTDDLSLPIFSGFYALCSWAIGYMWNIMWLDGFALLPLVALGTVQLLQDKKFIVYTVSLFLSVFINYYIGFFICIFVLLLFICYQICRWTTFGRFFEDLCRIALFTVLALGMSAVLFLPAMAALQNTYSSVNKFPTDFALNMADTEAVNNAKAAWSAFRYAYDSGEGNCVGLWFEAFTASLAPILDCMRKVAGNMAGGLTPTFKSSSDLPNIYCGVGSALFAFLFLTSSEVKLRDKICSVVLLLFLMLSFILRQLDYIWHGFHFPNEIPYRFSFLYSFVVLYMAYRAFLLRDSFKPWQLIVAGVVYVAVMLCSDSLSDPIFLAFNIIFLLLYTGVLTYIVMTNRPVDTSKKDRANQEKRHIYHKQISSYVLAGVLALDLALSFVNGGTQFPFAYVGNYPRGGKDVQTIAQYMQEQDDSLFYRAELTHTQTLNDSSLIGFNGVSCFTSSANVNVTRFLGRLGLAGRSNWNRYIYEESSPVTNLFLNLKYLIDREGALEENPYFDTINELGQVTLLKNNAYLPLGFLADSPLADINTDTFSNTFDLQNALFSAATGLEANVWMMESAVTLEIDGHGTGITSQNNSGYCAYKNEDRQTYLHYTYTAFEPGFMCLDMTMSARNSYTVWKNGTQLFSEEMGGLPQSISVCQVEPGDMIQVQIKCKPNESGTMTIRPAILNEELFRSGYDRLNSSTLELNTFTNTNLVGTVNCDRDGLLYTSIPQNGENWRVTVDGEEADIVLVGDVMIGVPLSKGVHQVHFTYHNTSFSWGLAISLSCLVLFLGIVFMIYFYPQIKRTGKYSKDTQ